MPVDFICIGAQKSATSWFHTVMSKHPQILASDPKELNYFNANYDRGARWYERHFAAGPADGLRGECSPNYFCSADAPVRARAYNPDLKLIAILRDPVARVYSNHLHEIRKGHIPETMTLREGMENNATYVAQSRYKANLERWIAGFGRAQLLVLLAEDVGAAPLTVFGEVCAFLGIDGDNPPEALTERNHENVAFRLQKLQGVMRSGGDMMRGAGLESTLRKIKGAPGIRDILSLNKRDLRTELPPLTEADRVHLEALFAEDTAYVADLLGRDTLPWGAGASAVLTDAARSHASAT